MNLTATVNMVVNLEGSTRGQGVNPNWMKVRKCIITASHMGDIVKRQKCELDALVKRIMYSSPIVGVKSLSYGNKNEAKARREYARWHIKKCGSVVVEDRGLIVNVRMPYIGASIDGSVKCDHCGEGIVEIKCPYGSKKEKRLMLAGLHDFIVEQGQSWDRRLIWLTSATGNGYDMPATKP